MKDTLKTLIELPTIAGDLDANKQGLDYLDHFLSKRGMRTARHEWNGFGSLVATTQKTKTPTVFLAAHLDVVPGPKKLFTLREENGNFFGRGTFDMKFAIAAYLELVDKLKDNLNEFDFGIMITTDEELGGANGVIKLIETGYIPKVCVLPDGGDNWAIETFAKGIMHLELETYGKSAHGSRPWEGENAIDKLVALLAEIKQLFPEQAPDSSTITISQIHAGDAINQIPASAKAGIDVRPASVDEMAILDTAIQELCSTYGATINVVAKDGPYINDPENPYIKQFADQIEEVIGYPCGNGISFAASDGRFYGAIGVPCVIVRPPGGGHHGSEEWIEAKGFYELYDVLYGYLQKTAKTKQTVDATLRSVV